MNSWILSLNDSIVALKRSWRIANGDREIIVGVSGKRAEYVIFTLIFGLFMRTPRRGEIDYANGNTHRPIQVV